MTRFGRPASIQAAAVEVTAAEVRPQGRTQSKDSPLADPTEERMWDYWEQLGVISFPVGVMSNVAKLVTYFPGEVPEVGEDVDPALTENSAVVDQWKMVGGEQMISKWVSDLVRHYWVPGQAWLAATRIVGGNLRLVDPDDETTRDDAKWEILSTADLKRAGGWEKSTDIPVDDARFWRLYTPSPRRRTRPDSPVRHVAQDCEMLLLYKHDLTANSIGRTTAGIKTMPRRLMTEQLANGKTFEQQLVEDMQSSRTPGNPASQWPLISWVEDAEEAAIINAPPVKMADPKATEDLLDKIEAAVRAIAVGLDMPPEFLTGLGGVNHWGAWLVQRQNYDYHLDPLVVRILEDLTVWWQARLKAANVPNPERYVLARNPESAISNPNSWDQAKWLWENYLIDNETARAAADVGEVSEPDMEEIRVRILTKALSSPLALSAVPGLTEGSDLTPGGAVPTAAPGLPASPNPADSNDMPVEAIQAATRRELDRLARRLAVIDQTLIADVEQAVAREAARLSRNLKARIAAAARAAGITVADEDTIAEELGLAAVLTLLGLAAPDEMVTPGQVNTDRPGQAIAVAQEATDRALSRVGATPPPTREQDRDAATRRLASAVAAAVVGSVFKRPTPQGEAGPDIVPFADVRRALDAAGGADAARSADGEEAWELVGNGRHTVTALNDAGIGTQAFRWVYGTTPRQTFEPHLRLDGDMFERWDADVLDQSGTGGEWVGGTHFYPGDHRGCRCTYERVLVDRAGIVSLAASLRG